MHVSTSCVGRVSRRIMTDRAYHTCKGTSAEHCMRREWHWHWSNVNDALRHDALLTRTEERNVRLALSIDNLFIRDGQTEVVHWPAKSTFMASVRHPEISALIAKYTCGTVSPLVVGQVGSPRRWIGAVTYAWQNSRRVTLANEQLLRLLIAHAARRRRACVPRVILFPRGLLFPLDNHLAICEPRIRSNQRADKRTIDLNEKKSSE